MTIVKCHDICLSNVNVCTFPYLGHLQVHKFKIPSNTILLGMLISLILNLFGDILKINVPNELFPNKVNTQLIFAINRFCLTSQSSFSQQVTLTDLSDRN